MNSEAESPPRIRLFRSDRLERLTVISPRAFAAIWAAILSFAALMCWRTAGVVGSIALFALGVLIWTLFEYAMHRFLFHWKARSQLVRSMVFVTHGNHHADPNDPRRNMMPPVVSVPILGTVWGLSLLTFGPAGSNLFLGFGIGYVLYDSVHYACHQFPMRHGLLKHLRRHHIRHHHAKQDGNYAITAIVWDRVLGTRIPDKSR